MGDIAKTYGSLLAGGLVSTVLTGVVSSQCFIYWKIYRSDSVQLKTLVTGVWLLDLLHTTFICLALWDYLIVHINDRLRIDAVPWSIACTVAFTALMTFTVQIFYTVRIFKLSKKNWYITTTLATLTCARLACACTTTTNLIRFENFSTFLDQPKAVAFFTLGLSLSTFTEILIAIFMTYYLNKNRSIFTNMNVVIDSLIVYGLESGALTGIVALASLLCWLIMPHNLIFFAIHFSISKLYANSILITLNVRAQLRTAGTEFSTEGALPVVFPPSGQGRRSRFFKDDIEMTASKRSNRAVQITITRTIEEVSDSLDSEAPLKSMGRADDKGI